MINDTFKPHTRGIFCFGMVEGTIKEDDIAE